MSLPSVAAIELGHLQVADPVAWALRVRRALEQTGSVTVAAKALGISARHLRDLVSEHPALREGLALRGAGRPHGSTETKPGG